MFKLILPILLTFGMAMASPALQAAQADIDIVVPVTAPTENVDGSPLTDLSTLTLWWGTEAGVYNESKTFPISAAGDTVDLDFTATGLLGGTTLYIAATATDLEGDSSDFSNEISRLIEIDETNLPPNPPVVDGEGLTVTVTITVCPTGKTCTVVQ